MARAPSIMEARLNERAAREADERLGIGQKARCRDCKKAIEKKPVYPPLEQGPVHIGGVALPRIPTGAKWVHVETGREGCYFAQPEDSQETE